MFYLPLVARGLLRRWRRRRKGVRSEGEVGVPAGAAADAAATGDADAGKDADGAGAAADAVWERRHAVVRRQFPVVLVRSASRTGNDQTTHAQHL